LSTAYNTADGTQWGRRLVAEDDGIVVSSSVMEQQAQKLANEFGVSLRRAKQALKTANGVVELAIDEILLTLRNSFASLALVY
jgi:hypothetical protein